MDYQEAFEKAGTLGKAQFVNIVMVFVVYINAGWQTIVPVFTAIDVPFYCADNSTMSSNSTLYDNTCVDDCQLYVYKQDVKSIVSEFDLACGNNKIMSSVSNSALWVSSMFSTVLMGAASDRYGRKRTFMLNTSLYVVCSSVTAFSQSIWFYTVFRFITGFFYGGVSGPAFLILAETVERDYLAQLSTGAMVIFAVGEISGAVIGYLSKSSWRLQVIIVSGVPIPILAGFALFVPESPMWLYSKKRYREAEKVLRHFAQFNGNNPSIIILPNEEVDSLGQRTGQSDATSSVANDWNAPEVKPLSNSKEEHASLLDLFKTFPAFMLSIGQICSWFTVSLVYYGLTFGVDGISGDTYVNSILLAVCEIPVWLVAFPMDKFGRKITFYVFLILSSVACLILPFTKPVAGGTFQIAFAMVGKCMVTAAYDLLYTYTPELYPTVLRGSGLLLCSGAAIVATILAPFVAQLDYGIYNCTPYIIFAVFGFASSLFTIVYGYETLGKPLLNTKEEFFIAAGKREIRKGKISKLDAEVMERLH